MGFGWFLTVCGPQFLLIDFSKIPQANGNIDRALKLSAIYYKCHFAKFKRKLHWSTKLKRFFLSHENVV